MTGRCSMQSPAGTNVCPQDCGLKTHTGHFGHRKLPKLSIWTGGVNVVALKGNMFVCCKLWPQSGDTKIDVNFICVHPRQRLLQDVFSPSTNLHFSWDSEINTTKTKQ